MNDPFRQIWDQLRAKKTHMEFFLDEARLRGLRGIRDLTLRFPYPLTVLAGPNACGKSTVLFVLACAYRVPGAGVRDFVPSTLFPNFRAQEASDPIDKTILDFYYVHEGSRRRMRWTRGKSWNRSYPGEEKGRQPERSVYLRTLANLSNPAEVRSFLQLGRNPDLNAQEITADQLAFAHRVLAWRYERLVLLSSKRRDLLFAQRTESEGASKYSEFHMSSGERSILRLGKEISQLRNALVLIDEVEAGLHPQTQQQLLLELQRLALRRDLQTIVTTHSPVVLDSVPPEGRIFLERRGDNVVVPPPYRDLIQKALYGQSQDKLLVLCEDRVAEALLRGVFDVLNPKLDLTPSDIEVGRDTGKDEFPSHVRTLARLGQLDSFIFVLDGDARDAEAAVRQAARDEGQAIRLLFLPGTNGPEDWLWGRLEANTGYMASQLGIGEEALRGALSRLKLLYENAADTARNKSKNRLTALAQELGRTESEIARLVGRYEAGRETSELGDLIQEVEREIDAWRRI